MIAEPVYPFVVDKGRPWLKVIRIRNSATQQPVSLAGCGARMVVREKPGADIILDISDGDGITIDEDQGTLTILVGESDVNALPVGAFRYDMEIQYPDGTKPIVLTGPFTVRARMMP
jgi:hypothetical protein